MLAGNWNLGHMHAIYQYFIIFKQPAAGSQSRKQSETIKPSRKRQRTEEELEQPPRKKQHLSEPLEWEVLILWQFTCTCIVLHIVAWNIVAKGVQR